MLVVVAMGIVVAYDSTVVCAENFVVDVGKVVTRHLASTVHPDLSSPLTVPFLPGNLELVIDLFDVCLRSHDA